MLSDIAPSDRDMVDCLWDHPDYSKPVIVDETKGIVVNLQELLISME
jgi:hypothetical protein